MAPRPTWEGHLRLSLVACPRPLEDPTDPTEPIADPAQRNVIEPESGSPRDAGPPPQVEGSPEPGDFEDPTPQPARPPPMDPKIAPLRV